MANHIKHNPPAYSYLILPLGPSRFALSLQYCVQAARFHEKCLARDAAYLVAKRVKFVLLEWTETYSIDAS